MADIKYRIGLGANGDINAARTILEAKIFTADKAKPEASGGFPFRFTADSTIYTADGSKPE